MTEQRGFSLIELMIVVVIVSILFAVVIPTYQTSVTKSRRADAKSMLLQILQAQEQFFAENLSYTTDFSLLGYSANTEIESDEGYYRITASPCAGFTSAEKCVALIATPQNGQEKDGALTVNSLGDREPFDKW